MLLKSNGSIFFFFLENEKEFFQTLVAERKSSFIISLSSWLAKCLCSRWGVLKPLCIQTETGLLKTDEMTFSLLAWERVAGNLGLAEAATCT